MYPDAITRSCTRLEYARVCVLLDYHAILPKYVIILAPNEDGGKRVPIKVDVEFEWVPSKCTNCMTLGQALGNCPLNRPQARNPAQIYVPKTLGDKVEAQVTNLAKSRGVGQGTSLWE
ncbi:hypothetical protein Salat_1136700 [Sesamum alatum]|uniref:Zinc knuckle CX2CX4HX4C domain-containing protein n=1 Tax=Sesamum alatum TaxID=300844 RepID=A0AAE1YEE4_9LAMI|nr:hypothetical protein Salat_1136700 [Sesamum alatum]